MKQLFQTLGTLHTFRTTSPDYAPTFGIYAANDPNDETIIRTSGEHAEALVDIISYLPDLLEALEAVAGTPKHGEPEIYDPEFKQNWEEDMGRHAIDQLHSLIDTARAALQKAGYTP